MLPRIPLAKVADETSSGIDAFVNNNRLKGSSLPSMPIIPPRLTESVTTLPSGSGDTSWYAVLSPRETRGLAGPFSIHQLKQMYKSRDITDRTLVWKEGEEHWQQLINQSLLRSRLISIPIIPPRLGTYNAELAVFDPIVQMPPQNVIDRAVPLENITFDRTCAVCGAMAVAHIPGYGEQRYDLFKGRHEVGTNENATEILPGFLWVGSTGASKHKFLLMVGITLVINCTDNLKNPLPHAPYFRCRDVPLREKPEEMFGEREVMRILDGLEKVYDVIENERLNPEKNVQSDPPAKYHRGPFDEYGFPIKSAEDKPFRRPGENASTPFFPPRVILWSRLGTDRAVFVAVAYIVKQYGISLKKALKIMKKSRPVTDISPSYMRVLEIWSQKYTLGMLLCVDCKLLPFKESSTGDGDKGTLLFHLKDSLKSTLPRLITRESDKRIANEVDSFVVGIRQTYFKESPWAKIIDINLSDRRLSDATIATLFHLMGASGAIGHIRTLNFSNNEVSFMALKAMLSAFFPYVIDPDESNYSDYADEEQSPQALASLVNELSVLDLSHNRIELQGAKYLALFLKLCEQLMWVNLFGNNLPDEGLQEILTSLTTPTFDFQSTRMAGNRDSFMMSAHHDDDDEWNSHASHTIDSMHNRSVTYLDLGGNSFGEHSAHALSQMLRQNAVLQTLRLEHTNSFSSMYFKDVANAIRLYNGTLNSLFLSGISLSVGAAKHLARIHESLDTRITKLVLNDCGIFHLQIKAMATALAASNFLSFLDLSNNRIGAEGIEALVTIVKGGRNKFSGKRTPPLRHLDVTKCQLGPRECSYLMDAVATSDIQELDMSYNEIGSPNDAFVEAFRRSRIVTAHFNYCNMHTSTSVMIFKALHDGRLQAEVERRNATEPLGLKDTLRSLCIAGNTISDSAVEHFVAMLNTNTCLEHVDLGFNNLTNHAMEYFKLGIKVNSTSSDAQKVTELNINLVGNKCDPYAMDTPGLSRSKVTFRFGVLPDKDNADLLGYSHVSDRARGKFIASKMLDDQFRAAYPQQEISTLY